MPRGKARGCSNTLLPASTGCRSCRLCREPFPRITLPVLLGSNQRPKGEPKGMGWNASRYLRANMPAHLSFATCFRSTPNTPMIKELQPGNQRVSLRGKILPTDRLPAAEPSSLAALLPGGLDSRSTQAKTGTAPALAGGDWQSVSPREGHTYC